MRSADGRVGLGEQLVGMNAFVTTLIGSPRIALNDGARRRNSADDDDDDGERSGSIAISSNPFETTWAALSKRS